MIPALDAGHPECRSGGVPPIRLSDHAIEAMARRNLSEVEVRAVATAPEQVFEVRRGRVLAQSIRRMSAGDQVYLLRVVIDIWPEGLEVVTACKTSRIAKYWRGVQ